MVDHAKKEVTDHQISSVTLSCSISPLDKLLVLLLLWTVLWSLEFIESNQKFCSHCCCYWIQVLQEIRKTITILLTSVCCLLKGLCHAICYVFKKLKDVRGLRINNIIVLQNSCPKLMVQFCYLKLVYLGIETVSCRLFLRMARMNMG